MTEQEKAALLQFIGVTHAQAKQTDQMIVGHSQFLKPVSGNIEQHFTQVLHTPVTPEQGFPLQYHQPEPVHNAPDQQISNEEQIYFNFEQQSNPNTPSTLVGSEEIINQLKEINLNLINIAAILNESNVKTKTKNTIKG
jgi:hypothetical protein